MRLLFERDAVVDAGKHQFNSHRMKVDATGNIGVIGEQPAAFLFFTYVLFLVARNVLGLGHDDKTGGRRTGYETIRSLGGASR